MIPITIPYLLLGWDSGKALLVKGGDEEGETRERKVVCSGGDLHVVKSILTPEQGGSFV